MQGLFAFQRTGASVSIAATTGVATTAAFVVARGGIAEIVNTSTTASAAFVFTDAGASGGTAATTTARTVPPLTALHEQLPQGASFASVISGAGAPTVIFTPGVSNG